MAAETTHYCPECLRLTAEVERLRAALREAAAGLAKASAALHREGNAVLAHEFSIRASDAHAAAMTQNEG